MKRLESDAARRTDADRSSIGSRRRTATLLFPRLCRRSNPALGVVHAWSNVACELARGQGKLFSYHTHTIMYIV